MLYAVKTRMVDFMKELESGEVNVNSTIDLVSVSCHIYCFASVENLILYVHVMYLGCPPAYFSWKSRTGFHMQNLKDKSTKQDSFDSPELFIGIIYIFSRHYRTY